MTATPTLTPAELAEALGTDARTTRKFLRSITPKDQQPGKGSRWAIKGTKTELNRLRKAFTEFETAQAAAKAARETAKTVTPEVAPEVTDAAREALAEVRDEEPTDEELREAEMLLIEAGI